MDTDDILKASALDGVSLTLADDGQIQYAGPAYAVRYWLPILEKHQGSIREVLTTRAAPDLPSLQTGNRPCPFPSINPQFFRQGAR